MNNPEHISLLVAFGAGLLSFISPCVLPLVPSYISYITGLSVEELSAGTDKETMWRVVILNSLAFIAGFSSIFVAFGASASLIGGFLLDYQNLIRQIGGVIIIIFGCYLLGLLNFSFLATEKRFHFKGRPAGLIGSYLIGVGFAAGWTPCVGPILGSILLYASTDENVMNGVRLLAFYSMGIAVPLFLISLGINRFLISYRRLNKYMGVVLKVSGVFLLILGFLIISDSLTVITAFFNKYNIGWDASKFIKTGS